MPEWGNPKGKLKWLKDQFGEGEGVPDWLTRGALGTQAFADEARYMSFLASLYGSWVLAAGYRSVYAFQNQNAPLYQWWLKNGKPREASGYREARTLAAKKPIDPRGEATVPFQFQPSQIRAREKAQAAGAQPGLPQIQSSGGYDWQLVTDPTTGEQQWVNIRPTDTSAQRLEEDRRQFDIEFGQTQSDIMNKQREQEWEEQRLRAQAKVQLTFGSPLGEAGERSAQNAYKAQLAKQFEDTMRDILSTTAPRDWVVRAKAQQALQSNPFALQVSSLGDQWSASARDLAIENLDLARLKRMIKSGDVPTTKQLENELAAKDARVKMAEVIEKHKRKQFEESPEIELATPKPTTFGGGFEVGRPSEATQPKPIGIPKELGQAFGITRFGQPPARPSGQQWNKATFTAREQFKGYNEALGANWEDVRDQMAIERPQNLTLGRTWQPARSMI